MSEKALAGLVLKTVMSTNSQGTPDIVEKDKHTGKIIPEEIEII